MSLEPDISERIQSEFTPEDQAHVLNMLKQSRHTGRVARCIVFAAQGSLDKLSSMIELANLDPRDAIMAGEYDANRDRLRDLGSSFLIDSPEKFWISQVANQTAQRNFSLIEIKQQRVPASADDPATSILVRTAIFQGPHDRLTIENKNRTWRIVGEETRLKRFFMDRVFHHEKEFIENLGSYLTVRPNA
ncbi:hypothetical protein Pan97_24200 [Bremerella volcania]|uniref:Uncharacterized protein n=1 Tax=Bremerella volcania TaxID=2527984 RepID=A0A518C846_9BACT|nr:hypothetical protein [Bremerella volcania]QDU75389.1 hypothetical protein Pan97_24200 [Bremerella volcania]